MCHRSGDAEGRTPSVRTYRGELLPPFGAPCCLPTITRHVGQYAKSMSPCCRATTTLPFLSNHLSRFPPLGLAPPLAVRQAERGSLGAARASVAASPLGHDIDDFARHQLGDGLEAFEACGQRALRAGDGRGRRAWGRAAKLRAHERDVFILWGNGTRRRQRAVRQDQCQQWAVCTRLLTWRMSSAMREMHSPSGRCAGAKGRKTATGSHLPPPSERLGLEAPHRRGEELGTVPRADAFAVELEADLTLAEHGLVERTD
ncbi:hypothetical protein Ctob_012254, partial [Chrysochromulina tobinii]